MIKLDQMSLERSQLGYTRIKNPGSNGPERSPVGYTMTNLGQMVLKGGNWVHNTKIRFYGLESSQLGTESFGYRVIWVHNHKIRSYGFERSQLGYTLIKVGTQCKNQVIWS